MHVIKEVPQVGSCLDSIQIPNQHHKQLLKKQRKQIPKQ